MLTAIACLALVFCFPVSAYSNTAASLPEELRRGMVQFEVARGQYLSALSMLSANDQSLFPVLYASALNGFGMEKDKVYNLLKLARKNGELSPAAMFQMGKIYYQQQDCVPALKSFKGLKNKLSLETKQEWAFYRANCSIILGSKKKAGQVLSDHLSGLWVSHAYYNLAMAFSEASTNKTRALVSLRVAASLNPGKTRLERELNDRIYYAAGAFYLENEKAKLASDFLKKINLDSIIAPQALYLHGLTLLEQRDFRAATQSWNSVRKYPTIHQGVPESLLAIPYAYEGAGYVTQALEAYLEASKNFEKELEKIRKVRELLKKYGIQDVLIEENQLEGLEWFLAKDIARNTQRAAYYTYLIEDEEIYDTIAEMTQLIGLHASMKLTLSELDVYEKSLKSKSANYGRNAARYDKLKFPGKLKKLNSRAKSLGSRLASEDAQLGVNVQELESRIKQTKAKIKQGAQRLKDQRKRLAAFESDLKQQAKTIQALIKRYNDLTTDLAVERLSLLEASMLAHYERAEQGLVHMLENVAEANAPLRNRLDRRYQ